ncbi:MAG: hypothetical protein IJO59_03360 [Clostridia bacterium]|nr:hypothetical protein [Clostridia bacterium]
MLLSVITATVFGVVGAYMVINGKYAFTRKMSWIPFAMAAMELAMCGALDVLGYPVCTLILMVCRVTVVACCRAVLKRDAAMERNRRRRRAVWRRIAATEPSFCVVEGAAAPSPLRITA